MKNVPISGNHTLLTSQIAYHDLRDYKGVNKPVTSSRRDADGVSVFPAELNVSAISGTPMAIPNWKMHNLIGDLLVQLLSGEETCTGNCYLSEL